MTVHYILTFTSIDNTLPNAAQTIFIKVSPGCRLSGMTVVRDPVIENS